MIKIVSLTNNEISNIVMGIEKKIVEYFLDNRKLKEDELSIINIFYYDNREIIIHRNFLILKSTQNKFFILEKYEIKTDTEDIESNIEGNFLNILNKITTNVDLKEVENYKYLNNIKDIWKEFTIPFGYL